jgi:hypothetical protein
MIFTGKVIKEPFAVGSKHEHSAVQLITDSGAYILRRSGGHAFQDLILDALVGKTLTVDGILHGNTLIITKIEIKKP